MNRAPFAPVFLAVAAPLVAAQQPTWVHTRQGPVSGIHQATAPEVAPNGDALAGFTIVGGGTPSQPDLDVVVVRIGTAGSEIWQRTLGLGGDETATQVLLDDAHGALYVVGSAFRDATPPTLQYGPWVVWKLDPATGQVLWTRTHPGASGQGRALGAALDGAGGVVVAGATYPPGSPIPDAAAARFASDGSLVYARTIATAGPEYFHPPVAAGNGDVLLRLQIGDTNSSLHRVDAAGAETWSLVYGGVIGSVRVDSGGALVLSATPTAQPGRIEKRDAQGVVLWMRELASLGFASTAGSSIDVGPGDQIHVSNGGSGLARLAPDGSTLWIAHVPQVEAPFAGGLASVRSSPDGDSIRFTEGPAQEKEYVAVSRFDAAGNFRWTRAITGDLTEVIRPNRGGVQGLADGTIVLTGQLGQTPSNANARAFVARLADSSARFCFGDGSSGSCPCGNQSPVGSERGCAMSTAPSSSGARLADSGSPSLTSDMLRFDAVLGIASSAGFALLVESSSAGAAVPLHDGLLCLSGPVRRVCTGTLMLGSGTFPPVGTASVSARAALAGAPIAPGSTRHYQAYFRSTGGVCGGAAANLTNGVSVTWSP